MNYDDEPELAGYQPLTSQRSSHGRRRRRILQIIVILGVIGLVVPGLLTTASVASATAQQACAAIAGEQAPYSKGTEARFELFGPSFIGWECYTAGAYGGDYHLGSLGLIPSISQRP